MIFVAQVDADRIRPLLLGRNDLRLPVDVQRSRRRFLPRERGGALDAPGDEAGERGWAVRVLSLCELRGLPTPSVLGVVEVALRKVVQRLPAFLRPRAVPSSHVIAINGNSAVLLSLQDTAAKYPAMTGVCETRERLYLTRLFGHDLPYVEKASLPRQ